MNEITPREPTPPAPAPDRPSNSDFPVRIKVNLEKEWLSIEDVGKYLNVSDFVVLKTLRQKDIPGIKVGREWRVARVDLEVWVNQRRDRDS